MDSLDGHERHSILSPRIMAHYTADQARAIKSVPTVISHPLLSCLTVHCSFTEEVITSGTSSRPVRSASSLDFLSLSVSKMPGLRTPAYTVFNSDLVAPCLLLAQTWIVGFDGGPVFSDKFLSRLQSAPPFQLGSGHGFRRLGWSDERQKEYSEVSV
jgi:hypothetical protein